MRGAGNLEKIRVQNVRSLKDTEDIALSPITLLVGENSSGKSTFLRLFPLIKQSISKRTDGPLLWAGDVDDYVDFGSFAETVTNDGSDCMVFSFSFSKAFADLDRTRYYSSNEIRKSIRSNKKKIDISYSITVSQQNEHEYISNLKVGISHSAFEFILGSSTEEKKILVDGMSIEKTGNEGDKEYNFHYLGQTRSLNFEYSLPDISAVVNKVLQLPPFLEKDVVINAAEDYEYVIVNSRRSYALDLIQFVGQCLCFGIPWSETRRSLVMEPQKNFPTAKEFPQKLVSYLDEQSDEKIGSILAYFRQVHYIAPLRATAERYYRLRNLAIDEVDYQGKNLAMFLDSLPKKRMGEFQKWTQEYFGFKVIVDKSVGHLSVKISLGDSDAKVNMSDTGFGYSQILPIIAQIWDLSTHSRQYQDEIPLVIAIEQPELHLHPALQAKLAKAFLAAIKLAKRNGYQLQLLIETHSETIVNYFGVAIAKGLLSQEEVSVILFDKDAKTTCTQVRTSTYTQDGFLKDWPAGFFSSKEW